MNGFVGFEQLPVFCRRFGIGREFAVDLEAVPDCGTAVLVDSDAGSREKRRAERGVAGRGNRERKIEDVADDFAPDPAAPAASDEEQALHGKLHFFDQPVTVQQRVAHSFQKRPCKVRPGASHADSGETAAQIRIQ